jgi:hypothetical protein
MKLLVDSNGLILKAVTKETCICGHSPDGHCVNSQTCGVVQDYTVVVFNECDGSRLITDGFELPNYKWDSQLGYPVETTSEDFRSDSILWNKYLIKAREQYSNGDTGSIALDVLKLLRIEELRLACEADILNGFLSSAKDNTQKMYDFDYQDQANMTAYRASIDDGDDIYWKAKGELITYIWTAEEFKQLCVDAKLSRITKMRFYHELRYLVTVATTTEDVLEVMW